MDKFVSGMNPGKVLDRLVQEKVDKPLKDMVSIAIAKESVIVNSSKGQNSSDPV